MVGKYVSPQTDDVDSSNADEWVVILAIGLHSVDALVLWILVVYFKTFAAVSVVFSSYLFTTCYQLYLISGLWVYTLLLCTSAFVDYITFRAI